MLADAAMVPLQDLNEASVRGRTKARDSFFFDRAAGYTSINVQVAKVYIQELYLDPRLEATDIQGATTLLRRWAAAVLDCRTRFPARLRSVIVSVKRIQRAFRSYIWKRNAKLERILKHWMKQNHAMSEDELTQKMKAALAYVHYVQEKNLYVGAAQNIEVLTRKMMDEKKKRTYDVNMMMEVIAQKYLEEKQVLAREMAREKMIKEYKVKGPKFSQSGGLWTGSSPNRSPSSGPLEVDASTTWDTDRQVRVDPFGHVVLRFNPSTFDTEDAMHRYEALQHADEVRGQTVELDKMMESLSTATVEVKERSFNLSRFESGEFGSASFLALSSTLADLEQSDDDSASEPDSPMGRSLSRKQSVAAISVLQHITRGRNKSSVEESKSRKGSKKKPKKEPAAPKEIVYDDLPSTGFRGDRMLWSADLDLYYRVRAARIKANSDRATKMADERRKEEQARAALLSAQAGGFRGKRRPSRSPRSSPTSNPLTPNKSPISMSLTPSSTNPRKQVVVVTPIESAPHPPTAGGDEPAIITHSPLTPPLDPLSPITIPPPSERRSTLQPDEAVVHFEQPKVQFEGIDPKDSKDHDAVSVLLETHPTKSMQNETLHTTQQEKDGVLTVETVREITTTTLIRTVEQTMSKAELGEARSALEEQERQEPSETSSQQSSSYGKKAPEVPEVPLFSFIKRKKGSTHYAPEDHEVVYPSEEREQLFHHKSTPAANPFDDQSAGTRKAQRNAKLSKTSPNQKAFAQRHAIVQNKPGMDRSLVTSKISTPAPNSPARIRPGSAALFGPGGVLETGGSAPDDYYSVTSGQNLVGASFGSTTRSTTIVDAGDWSPMQGPLRPSSSLSTQSRRTQQQRGLPLQTRAGTPLGGGTTASRPGTASSRPPLERVPATLHQPKQLVMTNKPKVGKGVHVTHALPAPKIRILTSQPSIRPSSAAFNTSTSLGAASEQSMALKDEVWRRKNEKRRLQEERSQREFNMSPESARSPPASPTHLSRPQSPPPRPQTAAQRQGVTVATNSTTVLISASHRPASAVKCLLNIEGGKARSGKPATSKVAQLVTQRSRQLFSDEEIARRKTTHQPPYKFSRPQSAFQESWGDVLRQDGKTQGIHRNDKLPKESLMDRLEKVLSAAPM